MEVVKNSTSTEIRLDENENSTWFFKMFLGGYMAAILLFLYGLISSVILKDWWFVAFTGLLLFVVGKGIFRVLKITSNLKMLISNSEIKFSYEKFGKNISEENYPLTQNVEAKIQRIENKLFKVNGNAVLITLKKKKKIMVGMTLNREDAELIKKEIETRVKKIKA